MITMTTKELTEYLRQLVLLESSIYQQEKSLDRARIELSGNHPEKEKVEKPKKPTVTAPEPPKPYVRLSVGPAIGFLAIGVFGTIGFPSNIRWIPILLVIGSAMVLLIHSLSGLSDKKEAAKAQAEYEKQLAAYEDELANANARYEDELVQYQKEKEAAQAKYQSAMQVYESASKVVESMVPPREECIETLEKLYALDIIFPKYRNMVAVCSLYEYLLSGRCSTLEGPDGAYNLYESELRQNIIIEKLDTIINKLDIIIKNQYTLYSELQKTNEILGGIEADVKNLVKSTNEIKEYSRITAVCAHATAQNTEALKYLALING